MCFPHENGGIMMYNGYTMGQWAESLDNFFMGVQWIFERLLNLHWWLIGLGILSSILGFNVSESTTGWWFGTWFLFVHSVGNVIIPTDFHMFHRGRYTTNQIMLESLLTNGAMEWRRVFFHTAQLPARMTEMFQESMGISLGSPDKPWICFIWCRTWVL